MAAAATAQELRLRQPLTITSRSSAPVLDGWADDRTRERLSDFSQKRFVGGFLASCLAVLAAVLAFNVLIDPFALAGTGIVPTAVEPDRSIKLDLLQRAIAADPEPDQFEGWLQEQCFAAGPGEGGVRAMALSIFEEWRLAREADYFRDWLARGAPSDDAPRDRAAR